MKHKYVLFRLLSVLQIFSNSFRKLPKVGRILSETKPNIEKNGGSTTCRSIYFFSIFLLRSLSICTNRHEESDETIITRKKKSSQIPLSIREKKKKQRVDTLVWRTTMDLESRWFWNRGKNMIHAI
jgi:hypothetical protein